ncbi:cytochrome P450 704C1-like protein isoform X1 [Cinnamomum micranthum f. kanehirae]|uniref:Cytochrome P450 704C1-like protein isoform X1 n=1 Tax=Cinnamomum micranthum f. kanehirae TaxID=337451 RepID=A0A3S3M723_9MAGN|nr:cytochrome P450 704C1-like protein isoform X1 [Cinnamomum micranthum f. kanehirae]
MDFFSNAPPISFVVMAAKLLLALLVFKVCFFYLGGRWSVRKKQYHPIAGTTINQLWNFSRLHDYFTVLAYRYKTFRILTPGTWEVFTVDPANIEYILKTNFDNYAKGRHQYNILKDFLGDGIFTVDGEKWRHQRKLASNDFSTRALREFSSTVFQINAAKLAQIVSKEATSNRAMDILLIILWFGIFILWCGIVVEIVVNIAWRIYWDLFMKSTLSSIFKVGFGTELNALQGLHEEESKFNKAFDESSALTLWCYLDVFWKIKKLLNIGSEAILKKNIKVINEFVCTYTSCIDLQKEKDDMLSRFLVLQQQDQENMNDDYLRDIILNFIIAGRDSTATTLSWFFYMLCKNPLVQKTISRVVEEATRANNTRSIHEFAEALTEEALNKMHYLHAALTETLRLYPAVPVDGKICLSDDTLPDGFNVREGDMVAYLPYAMGRMKFLWGDEADVFRPERWLDNEGVFQPESPFKFTAFQAGPRICIGKEFAYRQMKIFVAVLLHFFTFKLKDENKAVKYRTMINLHIDQGLYLHAYHR